MINYRSIADLNRCIVNNLYMVPADIEIIVGIPRSGMLAATLIALHNNAPLTDLDGYLNGRILSVGARRQDISGNVTAILNGRALIVDDSLLTGSAIAKAKAQVKNHAVVRPHNCIYCVVYGNRAAKELVDICMEPIAGDRIFEWNVMHSYLLRKCCVDIDGVLCLDPREDENDDGTAYKTFIANTPILRRTSVPIGHLVTSRLEKYREQTVVWLRNNNIDYGQLHMLDLPSKAARLSMKDSHSHFKAQMYASTDSALFIESNRSQAAKIALSANKPVLSVDTQEMIYPSMKRLVMQKSSQLPRFLHSWKRKVAKKFFSIDPPA